jgi:hypothetical protein
MEYIKCRSICKTIFDTACHRFAYIVALEHWKLWIVLVAQLVFGVVVVVVLSIRFAISSINHSDCTFIIELFVRLELLSSHNLGYFRGNFEHHAVLFMKVIWNHMHSRQTRRFSLLFF